MDADDAKDSLKKGVAQSVTDLPGLELEEDKDEEIEPEEIVEDELGVKGD